MDIYFECPHCGQQIVIDESGAGRQIDCPRCRSQATVPQSSSEEALPALSPDSKAQYRCNNVHCNGEWSEHQLLRETFNDKTVLLCPKCRFGVTEITKPVPFWSRMPDAFAYPFRSGGAWILVCGMFALVLLGFGWRIMLTIPSSGFSYLAIVVKGLIVVTIGTAVIGSFGMLLFDIIRATANGEEAPMKWPDVRSVDDLREPMLQLGGSALLVFSPAVICGFVLPGGTGHPFTLCLWGLGAAYYPMALLAVAMSDSVSGVNPLIVVPAIVRTLPQYLLVLAALAVMWLVYEGASLLLNALPWGVGWVISLPVRFCTCYSLAVAARLLGLLCRVNSAKLGWLE
jgi:DNA-directed RNA polymerase subunit RPC12/RpoP